MAKQQSPWWCVVAVVVSTLLVALLVCCCACALALRSTLGDGHELSTDVGQWIATSGPLIFVAFPSLSKGASSSSHAGLKLPNQFAKAGCTTSNWRRYDGTLLGALEIAAQTVNFTGLTLRSHVPLGEQFEWCRDQELLQVLSDLTCTQSGIKPRPRKLLGRVAHLQCSAWLWISVRRVRQSGRRLHNRACSACVVDVAVPGRRRRRHL
jgi:hypothetical protein